MCIRESNKIILKNKGFNMAHKKYPGIYPSIALITDFYEITMAYAYWKKGMKDLKAIFQMFFRHNPMKGGYTVFAGLETLVEFLKNYHFNSEDIDFLRGLKDNSGTQLFEEGFLSYLKDMRFSCDIMSVKEGSVVFPHEPILKVIGPIIQAQLLESIILNVINFQTLIATKASRINEVAQGAVLEFGLRRAQGIDGAISAARAAYIGGCSATSNVIAGKILGIPLKGTHAHSWVMAFENEVNAFKAYAEVFPANSIFLVDTYNTLDGVKSAIKAAKEMRKYGFRLKGIRLDSGDLAYLSIKARELLDRAGLKDCLIVASSSLNEEIIQSLRTQGAKIDVWGVGTKLVVGSPDGAIDGVYKLSAIGKDGKWDYKMKFSEKLSKVSITGNPLLRRYYDEEGIAQADIIYDKSEHTTNFKRIRDPFSIWRSKALKRKWKHRELLHPVFKKGRFVGSKISLKDIQDYVKQELKTLHPGLKRFINPHEYPVGISEGLFRIREELIQDIIRRNTYHDKK